MKITRFGLGMILLLASATGVLAQENTFGLRAGTFNFPDSELFSAPVFIERDTLQLFFGRAFDPDDFSGTTYEFLYTFRRDTDAHFQMDLSAGLYSTLVTETVPGLAIVDDPGDFNNNGMFQEEVGASVANTLEYTLYYVQVVPTWQFTTGKFRFFVGGGVGLWANLWREVVDADYPYIFTCGDPINFTDCPDTANFRQSEGNRRTIVPISLNAGFFYQFLPHWSFNIENRYLFNGDSSVNLWREDSTFTITQNQIFLGFSYRL